MLAGESCAVVQWLKGEREDALNTQAPCMSGRLFTLSRTLGVGEEGGLGSSTAQDPSFDKEPWILNVFS